ncbi:hypothetical protein CR513_09919, partial [Mucuna pruriens]
MEHQKIGCIYNQFPLNLGRHEAHVLGEILSKIQNRDHQEGNLWDKFYEGLTMIDQSMIDAASG